MEIIGSINNIGMSDILSDDTFNCRGRIAPVKVFELAKDIKEQGLLQPIVVQSWDKDGFKYRIVCGHRRFMAFRVNGETNIPCIVKKNLTEEDALLLNLTENINREDLNICQEAFAIKRFVDEGWSQSRIAQKLSVSSMWVRTRVAVLNLEPEIQRRAEAGMLTQHQIMDISSMPTREARMNAVQKAVDHKLKGERRSLKLSKGNKSVFTKKPRSVDEIHEMQDLVREVIGNGLTTRFADWTAGVISAREFYYDLRDEAESIGIDWSLPLIVAPPSA